jgi:hypothetical protein
VGVSLELFEIRLFDVRAVSCFTSGVSFQDVLLIGCTIDVLQKLRKRRRLAAIVADEEVVVGLAINIASCLQFISFGITAIRTTKVIQISLLLLELF